MITLLSSSVIFFSCSKKSTETIVNAVEIRSILTAETGSSEIQHINRRINFFTEKVKKDNFGCVTTGMLGNAYSTRFSLTGDINDIITSDSLLNISNVKYNGTKASVFVSLSMNALVRHEFKRAVDYAYSAYNLGENKSISAGVLFDALVETGEYEAAKIRLNSLTDTKEVSYLIRASKYKELTGDMDSAIIFMQAALEESRTNPTRPGLICWANNSLAALYIKSKDYAHAYEHYINTLKLDRNNYKALEGIAVIASLNDGNYSLAEEILLHVSKKISSPDPYLNLYKLAKRQNDEVKKKDYLDKFMKLSSNPAYGKMYNRYLAEIYADEFRDFEKAKQIAESEINERPSPASYFLLAWVYFKSGDTGKAIDIIKNNVEDKTYDPEILTKIDRIYLDETKKM
jgi:tetratricopeptide (TPR) repeat protein